MSAPDPGTMAFVYLYPPHRYSTTYIGRSFPETHWPMENFRHKFSDAMHHFSHNCEEYIHTPHTDVRETAKKYYIDVELPGLAGKDEVSLKWTNPKTLLVEANLPRPQISEELAEQEQPIVPHDDLKRPQKEVHLLTKERRVGKFSRAFSFDLDFPHHSVEATVSHGLLRLVVAKPEDEFKKDKEVPILLEEP